MNETIGIKGGKNDRRRMMLITKKMKEKLDLYYKEQKEKEFKELEKKVKIQQKLISLVAIPIATLGQTYLTLTKDNLKKKELVLKDAIELLEKENLFSEKDTQIIIEALKTGNIFSLDEELLGKLGLSFETKKQVSEIDATELIDEQKKEISISTKSAILNVIELTLAEKEQKLHPEKTSQEQISKDTPQELTIELDYQKAFSIDEQLEKLKNHKIIDEYEHKLKDVRKDLRNLIFEYNLISEASDNIYDSKATDDLLDKLNEIIKKVEELKRKIAIPNIDKYDDNYLYTLVADYIEEFKNQNFVSEIKDSALYIMISEKLDELDNKKEQLQSKLETKKTNLEITESKIEQIKEKYYNYEKFNKELIAFQESQDKILSDIKEKMSKAITVQEKVETQVTGMQRQSLRLLNLMAASMMLPGARSARGIATIAASYLYFMRNVMSPNTPKRTLKTINVADYYKEIESSISELDNVSHLLKKTSKQIDLTIKEVEHEFKEYINYMPELQNLLDNLEKIKDEISEKEYELERIKEEQQRNLEKNNTNVKKMVYQQPV